MSESFQKSMLKLITSLCGEGNVFLIPRVFVEITGSYETALFLSQLLYWSDNGKRKDGYIFKTMKEWQDELLMSEYAINKARKYLKEQGILSEKIHKANGNPTVHYKINEKPLIEFIKQNTNNEFIKLRLMEYCDYLKSEHWKKIRTIKLKKAKFQCEKCGNKNNLQVHHLTYERKGNEWLSDLMVLCSDCHKKEHGKE